MGTHQNIQDEIRTRSSCFSLLPQLSVFQQGRSSPSMTAPELSTLHQSRSHFHLTPKNAWTQYQLPKWKKSPKNNSLLPSKIVNFRMSNLLIREINNQH